jgi:hypothetical protein
MEFTFARPIRVAVLAALGLLGFAATVSSQALAANPPKPWNRGTTLELFAGAANASPNTMETFGTARQRAMDLSATARASFRDPTAVIAGGANFFVARHFSMRPEVTLRLVTNGSDVYKVTTLTVALIYHVEDHANGQLK